MQSCAQHLQAHDHGAVHEQKDLVWLTEHHLREKVVTVHSQASCFTNDSAAFSTNKVLLRINEQVQLTEHLLFWNQGADAADPPQNHRSCDAEAKGEPGKGHVCSEHGGAAVPSEWLGLPALLCPQFWWGTGKPTFITVRKGFSCFISNYFVNCY